MQRENPHPQLGTGGHSGARSSLAPDPASPGHQPADARAVAEQGPGDFLHVQVGQVQLQIINQRLTPLGVPQQPARSRQVRGSAPHGRSRDGRWRLQGKTPPTGAASYPQSQYFLPPAPAPNKADRKHALRQPAQCRRRPHPAHRELESTGGVNVRIHAGHFPGVAVTSAQPHAASAERLNRRWQKPQRRFAFRDDSLHPNFDSHGVVRQKVAPEVEAQVPPHHQPVPAFTVGNRVSRHHRPRPVVSPARPHVHRPAQQPCAVHVATRPVGPFSEEPLDHNDLSQRGLGQPQRPAELPTFLLASEDGKKKPGPERCKRVVDLTPRHSPGSGKRQRPVLAPPPLRMHSVPGGSRHTDGPSDCWRWSPVPVQQERVHAVGALEIHHGKSPSVGMPGRVEQATDHARQAAHLTCFQVNHAQVRRPLAQVYKSQSAPVRRKSRGTPFAFACQARDPAVSNSVEPDRSNAGTVAVREGDRFSLW